MKGKSVGESFEIMFLAIFYIDRNKVSNQFLNRVLLTFIIYSGFDWNFRGKLRTKFWRYLTVHKFQKGYNLIKIEMVFCNSCSEGRAFIGILGVPNTEYPLTLKDRSPCSPVGEVE